MTKKTTMAINSVKSTNLTVSNTMLNNIINKLNQDILSQNEFEYLSKIAKENQRGLISYFNNETGFGLKKLMLLKTMKFLKNY